MTRLLRALAVAIAVAGAVDPPVTLTGTTRARLAIVEQEPASAVSAQVRAQLVRELGAAYEIVPERTSDSAAAIVIGDRYPDSDSANVTQTIATVTIGSPNVRLVHVNAPREIPPATTIHLDVEVDAHGAAGQSMDLLAAR